MTATADARTSRTTRFRAVALLAVASLSCTTVRVPATVLPSSVRIRGDVAEPQVELWIESGKDVSPAEAARAAAQARAALGQALASRNLGAGEQLLVVRAQGVSRTGSRRTDQKAAVAGLVVAAVAIVAVAVVVLVASQGKGGGGKMPAVHVPTAAVPRPPPPGAVALRPPALLPAIPRPGTVPAPAPVAPSLPRPARGTGDGGVAVLVGADVQVPVDPAIGPPPAVWSETVVAGPPPAFPAAETPAEVVLPPPPPLDLDRRGFFAGDSTRLELTLVDRATARPIWVKTVEGDCDPRDAAAVRALLDRGLGDAAGWEPVP